MKERNWEQFPEWVKDYERERLKDKTPLQRIEIFEALYQAALTVVPKVNKAIAFYSEMDIIKKFKLIDNFL
ncbi:MAG TPA: hypothetical protein C5S37_07165 [Methanophagales archaeon]|nr:hypothetical protein [Methanophagales archaeon]